MEAPGQTQQGEQGEGEDDLGEEEEPETPPEPERDSYIPAPDLFGLAEIVGRHQEVGQLAGRWPGWAHGDVLIKNKHNHVTQNMYSLTCHTL